MSDAAETLDPSEAAPMQVQPPAPTRLVPAGQPAGPVIEALLGALHRGAISPKLGREMLIRLVPPAKPTVRLRLPPITDAASFAKVCRLIMRASATGRVAPSDAAVLLRNAKATFDATRADQRARLLSR